MGSLPKRICRIRLSVPLWGAATAAKRRETVYHEVAHIIVYAAWNERCRDPQFGDLRPPRRPKPHGREWKRVVRAFGYPHAKATHRVVNEDLNRRRGKVEAFCACDTPHWITKRMARKVEAGSIRFCRRCKYTLSFTRGGVRKVGTQRRRRTRSPSITRLEEMLTF